MKEATNNACSLGIRELQHAAKYMHTPLFQTIYKSNKYSDVH